MKESTVFFFILSKQFFLWCSFLSNLNWLPIHEASNYGFADIVDLLIKNGAKINDSLGPITPLHDASQNGHFDVVKLLLQAGALCYVFSQEVNLKK